MYWARWGNYREAEAAASELRLGFGDGRNPRVSILLMALEALIAYFKSLSSSAHDRMARAHLLSVATRDPKLVALTSGWLAHIAFNRYRYEEMTRALQSCLRMADSDDDASRFRASLTIADSFTICGEHSAARVWYERARVHATRLGDHASLGALTYNQAAFSAFVARLDSLDGPIPSARVKLISGQVNTAINYQAVAGLQSLQSLLEGAWVSARILSGEFDEAVREIQRLLVNRSQVSFSESSVNLRCDLALCHAMIGDCEESDKAIKQVSVDSVKSLAADDRLLACAVLIAAARQCGQDIEHSEIKQVLDAAAVEHRSTIDGLRNLMSAFRESV